MQFGLFNFIPPKPPKRVKPVATETEPPKPLPVGETAVIFVAGEMVVYGSGEPFKVLEALENGLLRAFDPISKVTTCIRAESCKPYQPEIQLGMRVWIRTPHQTGKVTMRGSNGCFWADFDKTKLGCWYQPTEMHVLH